MPVGQAGYSRQCYPGTQPQARAPFQGLCMGTAQQRLALPPGPQPAIPGTTFQSPQPRIPQYNPVPQGQKMTGGTGTVSPGAGEMTYSLPSFTTELGDQNLNMMALPPGPDDMTAGPGGIPGELSFPSALMSQTTPDTYIPASAPDVPEQVQQTAMEPSTGSASIGDVPGFPPAASEPIQQLDIDSPPVPEMPQSPDNDLPLADLDAFLAAAGKLQDTPMVTDTPAVTDTPPSPPANEPVPGPTEITMQCHACANTYKAEVPQLPVIVTCPHCQAEGMIESLPG